MKITDDEFIKKFKSKERLCCAGCGGTKFNLHPTPIPNVDVSEAIIMQCKNCNHSRLELI